MSTKTDSWFPLFEFSDFVYQSFLILPLYDEISASPSTAVTTKILAKGEFLCGQAFNNVEISNGYDLGGSLIFESNSDHQPELKVSIKGIRGNGNNPASFEGTGTGVDGAAKGAIYSFSGWAFPKEPIDNQAARILFIFGSVRSVRGPDTNPEIDLNGMPLGTLGSFVIVRRGDA